MNPEANRIPTWTTIQMNIKHKNKHGNVRWWLWQNKKTRRYVTATPQTKLTYCYPKTANTSTLLLCKIRNSELSTHQNVKRYTQNHNNIQLPVPPQQGMPAKTWGKISHTSNPACTHATAVDILTWHVFIVRTPSVSNVKVWNWMACQQSQHGDIILHQVMEKHIATITGNPRWACLPKLNANPLTLHKGIPAKHSNEHWRGFCVSRTLMISHLLVQLLSIQLLLSPLHSFKRNTIAQTESVQKSNWKLVYSPVETSLGISV